MDNKTQFKQWLLLNPPKKYSIETLIQALDDGSSYCCTHGISNKSLWEITDPSKFKAISTKLLGMRFYRLTNRQSAIVLDKAMPLYREFLIYVNKKENAGPVEARVDDSHGDTSISETGEVNLTQNNHSKLYQKLYSISRVYDDPSGLSFSKILTLLGNSEDEQQVRKILDNASWVTQLENDVYTFTQRPASPALETITPYGANSVRLEDETVDRTWIHLVNGNYHEFQGTRPIYCEVGGFRYEGKNWIKALTAIANHEIKSENQKIIDLYHKPLFAGTNTRPFFMKEKIEGRSCSQLANGYWINVNYSIPRLIQILYHLCIHCGYENSQINIYGISKDGTNGARKSFDIQEAAILLDEYLRGNKTGRQISETAELVSAKLRLLAKAKGVDIPSSFRSTIGIQGRLRILEELYKNIESHSDPGTEVFREILDLYNNNKDKYDKILENAISSLEKHSERSTGENDIKTVNLSVERDYAFTTPISFSYFGDETVVASWRKLYVNCIIALLEDYPSVIRGLLGASIFGGRGMDFADPIMSASMISPQKISDDIIVETNFNATNLMKRLRRLIALCNMDYENLQISFRDNASNNDVSTIPSSSIQKKHSDIKISEQDNLLPNNYWEKEVDKEPADYNKERFVQTLLRRYRSGMQFDSIDFDNFRETYEQLYDESITFNDIELEKRLRYCGVFYMGRLFPAEGIMDRPTNDKLFAYINRCFSSGKKVLYYKAIFEDLADTFATCYTLSDENMLHAYIEFTAQKGKYYFFSNYMSTEKNVSIDHTAEVEEYMLNAGKPIAIYDVCNALSHIPKNQVTDIITTSKQLLRNAKGQYFHIDIFEVSEEELDSIDDIISEYIQQNDYAIWTDVWNEIQDKMPGFVENNVYLSGLGIRNVLAQKFAGKFNFENSVISAPENKYSMKDIYQLYAKHHDRFSADDIYNLSKKMDTVIYLEALSDVSVRVSHDLFVSKDKIYFDVDAIDLAIASFMSKDYIRIKEIDSYLAFPNVGYEWNEYLLESFVHSFSQKFLLLNNGFSLNNVAGAIVKKKCSIKEFVDVCAAVLADAPISLSNQKALNYLVEVNMITRRSYRDLDSAVKKASRIRIMRG